MERLKPSRETADRWRVAAASAQGVSHARSGQPCQDAHAWTAPGGDLLILAVADGAGSAALSEVGATIAVREALRASAEAPASAPAGEAQVRERLIAALESAASGVEAEAATRDLPVQDLASTLILVLATPTGVAIAQVGDGAVVAGDADGKIFALTKPENGEYANTTTFLTSPGALENAQFVLHPSPITALAVFSDGLQRCALRMPDATPYAPFFTPLFRFVADEPDANEANTQLTAFLNSPRVLERTDDDITLILAALVPASGH
ncbi:MAG TPA: PP2C family serine/threonine-protein phosphatase [Chthonomonadaceae bacterium]|nr:PP2C family serine/threonine-protein phosphatase [Chthonomonadaceae bacterium]